ncbi:hypothetical protein, partial [[Eubacterium] cellulosolvens]
MWKPIQYFHINQESQKIPIMGIRFVTVMVLCSILLSIFSVNLFLFNSTVSGNLEGNSTTGFEPLGAARTEDSDNFSMNATELFGMGPNTINGNLSGNGGAGDDFVDYYKIFLDNYAISGANAHNLSLTFNTTATLNLTLSILDPDLHLLARSTTGAGYPNGTIVIVAQSTGMHYIKLEVDPQEGDIEYNFTYEKANVINNKLDNDNDFTNATAIPLVITDMGAWEKKEYDSTTKLPPPPYLNQTHDIHDFYNVSINATENISIALNISQGNTFGIELFNGSNTSRLMTHAQFNGSDVNTTLYFDINWTGNYYFRIYSVYDDPYTFGGTGLYNFTVLIKPQNTAPIVRMGAVSNINMFEDEPPRILLLNETIFFDSDVGNSSDQLSFYILNGSTWDTSYLSENLSVRISSDGNTSIRPVLDQNTTGEQLVFKAEDWLGVNITHTITVVVTPVNDGPVILSVNSIPVTSHYLNLTNDHFGYFGAWEDQVFTLTVNASDKEGNELEFVHKSTRSFYYAQGFNNPNSRNYSFLPDNTMVGLAQINVSVNESYDYSVDGDWVVVNISVNNTNDEPFIIKVDDVFYSAGSTVEFLDKNGVFVDESITFKITAVDVDLPYGDSLSFNTTNLNLLQRGVLKITALPGGAVITEREVNITYTPGPLDEGIQEINITVQDTAATVSYIILRIEVMDARRQYTLTDSNVTFDYDSEMGLEDDYEYYQLVYDHPESQSTKYLMAYTRRADKAEVDIVSILSRKVGDYMNISINLLSSITDDTIIRLFFVRPSFTEPPLMVEVTDLPNPYTPPETEYFLMLNYSGPNTEMPPDFDQPIIVGNNILKFSIHLGYLENDYGIKYGVEFGLFAQAYQKVVGQDEMNHFAYDSIGAGAADAPTQTKSWLLSPAECSFE